MFNYIVQFCDPLMGFDWHHNRWVAQTGGPRLKKLHFVSACVWGREGGLPTQIKWWRITEMRPTRTGRRVIWCQGAICAPIEVLASQHWISPAIIYLHSCDIQLEEEAAVTTFSDDNPWWGWPYWWIYSLNFNLDHIQALDLFSTSVFSVCMLRLNR